MHELSIASAILDQALGHVPAGAKLLAVRVRAGPQRGIDRLAMDMAWQALTLDTPQQGSHLELELLPWRLHCPDCGREFESDDALAPCPCGSEVTMPAQDDELRMMSIEVDEVNHQDTKAPREPDETKRTGQESGPR